MTSIVAPTSPHTTAGGAESYTSPGKHPSRTASAPRPTLALRPTDASAAAAARIAPSALDQAGAGLPRPQGRAGVPTAASPTVSPSTHACRVETPEDPKLYSSDFSWNQTLPELQARFESIYNSDKRLPKRAYWNEDAQRFELPHSESLGGPVVLPQSYIDAITSHIETAFKDDVVDAVFFPDMGHSHILIPRDLWDSKYKHYPVKQANELYRDMFSDPKLQTFYHTAEQLKTREDDGTLVDDPRTQHRYRTRNISGPHRASSTLQMHQNPDSRANTVHNVPGYRWWGAGFNVSANKGGCFPYTVAGKTYRFDISLYDLEPAPGANPQYVLEPQHAEHGQPSSGDAQLDQKVRRIYRERQRELHGDPS